MHEGRLRLVVANGGSRIDPDDVQALTEPFRRLKRSGSGFGLGLSIVRSVAEAHGGTLTLSAPSSGGLVAQVDLPPPRHASTVRPGLTETVRA